MPAVLRSVRIEAADPHVPHPQAQVRVDRLGDEPEPLRESGLSVVDSRLVPDVRSLHGVRAALRRAQGVVQQCAEARRSRR